MKKILLLSFVALSFVLAEGEFNTEIVNFVKLKMGQKVGDGSNLAFVKAAIEYSGATHNEKSGFGRKLNYKSEKVIPGDIMVFKNVKYIYGNKKYRGNYPDFKSIVYNVVKQGEFQLAEQDDKKMTVGVRNFNLSWMTEGTIEIYRPKK